MRIIVWGLGKIGRRWVENLLSYQDDLEIEVIAVTDSNRPYVLDDGIRKLFIDKENIPNLAFEYVVIASQKCFEEIRKELLTVWRVEKSKIIRYDKLFSEINIKPKYKCIMCQSELFFWNFCGIENNLFKKKLVIGAGRRRGVCPICGSLDRTRYEYYILKGYTDIFNSNSVLHFAPEKELEKLLRQKVKAYITADIQPERADVVADITKLQFQNEQFDYVICNHVLEHISDEKKALEEVKRCLKKRGKFIVTVPICWQEKTYEDPDIASEEDRDKAFGQSDHVRLYGYDIINRFEDYGFKVESYKSDEQFAKDDLKKYGFIEGDCVFILEK